MMPEKRGVLLNAAASLLQVVVTAGTLLLLYRYLLDTIGSEQAGIWALVLAWTSASGVANLGLAGSAVKFVSQYLARGDADRVRHVVQTSVLSTALFLGVMVWVLYPLLRLLIEAFIEPAAYVPAALSVLPYALVSFWLTSLAAVLQSCIDGTRRVYVRNVLVMISSALYLGLALVLVPRSGLVGLAQAQTLQAGVLLGAGWVLLRRLLPGLPAVPYRWRRDVFKEMFRYSVDFQVISFWTLLFEPTTKSLFARFGGIGSVFLFEMAQRMVIQLRGLVVSAHQSLVPMLAHLHETDTARVQEVYRESYRLLLFLVLPALPFLILLTPTISRLWIGRYEPIFVVSGILLMGGWFVNILSNPAYFGFMGTGSLRWNVRSHAVIGVLNGILGALLGWRFGGIGVVTGFVLALAAGSLVTMLAYQREHGIRFAELLHTESVVLAAFGAAGAGAGLWLDRVLAAWPPAGRVGVQGLVYGLFVAVPLWRHSFRPRLQQWLLQAVRKSPEPSSPANS